MELAALGVEDCSPLMSVQVTAMGRWPSLFYEDCALCARLRQINTSSTTL